MKIGLLPLGRPTFDIPYAGERLAAMLARLDATEHDFVGPRDLLLDGDAARQALTALKGEGIDHLLILQVTFTDAVIAVEAGAAFDGPLSIWAVPEPRLGGRLRLNAFCGLNLASHALGLNGRRFGWLFADPESDVSGSLADLLAGKASVPAPMPVDADPGEKAAEGRDIAGRLKGKRMARVGHHPDGFDTCRYSPDALSALAGVSVDEIALDTLFDAARAVPAGDAAEARAGADALLDGLDTVDQAELDRSLRLKLALDGLRAGGGYDAFAIRCWPETFTEYGGAVCGPVSMLGEARVPCACEADVYGALTQLVLQEAADAPVFLADLVDMDPADDTGVVWHCGQAPLSMCDDGHRAHATIHTNRKMPLLFEFPLKPGRVTVMRVSQAFGEPKMVLAGAEMLDREMAFTGTSGVLRFDASAGDMLDAVIASGLEHHVAIAYGEHRPVLRGVAAALGLPVLEL